MIDTDNKTISTLTNLIEAASAWEAEARLLGNISAREILAACHAGRNAVMSSSYLQADSDELHAAQCAAGVVDSEENLVDYIKKTKNRADGSDAESCVEIRRSLVITRVKMHKMAEVLAEAARDISQSLTETARHNCTSKKRPEGREHLPIAYELDRTESIMARLREENARNRDIRATHDQLRNELAEKDVAMTKLLVSFANLRKAYEENEDAVGKLQIDLECARDSAASADANNLRLMRERDEVIKKWDKAEHALDEERKAHRITRDELNTKIDSFSDDNYPY